MVLKPWQNTKYMTTFDVILLLLLFGFVWFGFWFGLIHAVGGVIGTVLGAWLAGHFYLSLVDLLSNFINLGEDWLKLISFFLIYLVINRLVGFLFYILDQGFSFLRFIPFLKTINRFGGALLGLVEGALLLGLTLHFALTLDLPIKLEDAIYTSLVASRLIGFASILWPLLPEFLRKIQPYIPVQIPQ